MLVTDQQGQAALTEPTYRGYIATTDDALLVFEACRLGVLQRRTRRLSNSERNSIAPGCVFVWDETESGIRRWTDGRRWSPSRVNGCFLVYGELESGSSGSSSSSSSDKPAISHGDGPAPAVSGLAKKTLSLLTTESGKLHLVCYYRRSDANAGQLATPSHDPFLRGIAIPRGLYPDILPEMAQPIAPHALPTARRRRLSGAPANILVRGCTSMQATQHPGSLSPPWAAPPAPAAPYPPVAPAAGPLQPAMAGVPALARRRRNSTTADYLGTAMHCRHRVAHALSTQTVPMRSSADGPGRLAPALPLAAHGPSAGPAVASRQPSCRCDSGTSTRRSSTLVAGDPAYPPAGASCPTAVGDGSTDDWVQLPPISELLKLIDYPRPPPPPPLHPAKDPAGTAPAAHKLPLPGSHGDVQRWNSHTLAATVSAHY
ncbi:Gluconate transport-inducing protein [Coemansia spiralis]|nr:Gluconate transport-inducing protein [Coemansia spiralis]